MKFAPSRRTLIVQPLPGIGDMVWHLPHIHAIAATTTRERVDILTKPRSQADRLLCADPSVGRILWVEREAGRHAGLRGLLRLAALLRQGQYQRAWFLHGSARYVLAALLAGIPERIGYPLLYAMRRIPSSGRTLCWISWALLAWKRNRAWRWTPARNRRSPPGSLHVPRRGSPWASVAVNRGNSGVRRDSRT